jgi:hypothetical protein
MNSQAGWRKSSYSTQDTACVEAACLTHALAVRDSKLRTSPVQIYTADAWHQFLDRLSQTTA